jgi:hypothetical protein
VVLNVTHHSDRPRLPDGVSSRRGDATPSYLTLWPDGSAQPVDSDLNWVSGETVPNLVVVKLGTGSTFDIFNAVGSTDVVIDLVGFYGASVPTPASSAQRRCI